jgi:hypothetical protein
LEVAIEIQSHAATIDPADHFGQGPTLEYPANLRRAIERFPDPTAP